MVILSLIINHIRSNPVGIPYRLEYTSPDLSLTPFDDDSQFSIRKNSRRCCFVENFFRDKQVGQFIVSGSTAETAPKGCIRSWGSAGCWDDIG